MDSKIVFCAFFCDSNKIDIFAIQKQHKLLAQL